MNGPVPLAVAAQGARTPLHCIALALLTLPDCDAPEARWLRAQRAAVPPLALQCWRELPPPEDAALHALAQQLNLHPAETLAVALAVAIEFDPVLARAVAWLQAPVGGARPTLGLLRLPQLPDALPVLLQGRAQACGLLQWDDEPARAMPERSLRVPLPLALALRGHEATWPGAREVRVEGLVPPSLQEGAAREAAALRESGGGLSVRSGDPEEALLGAALAAQELGMRAIAFEGEPAAGAGPWLRLARALPVLKAELGPGEVRRVARPAGYEGPLLVACGVDGSVQGVDEGPLPTWRVPLPSPAERRAQWAALLPEAAQPGGIVRRGIVQIRHLARAACRHAALCGRGQPRVDDLRRAVRDGVGIELGHLAHQVEDDVADDAFVVPPSVHCALDALVARCRRREDLAEELGAAARTRYRPGVRALFAGPSGTGKTLAAAWLATKLGLPLYRVDLAAVSSKYIGETEKNLAQLFARAEQAEVVLLFDEADSLFGKRTDVKDSNDRFANQQTNYLLQRIESFDGIALLTSNGRSRFDTAFTRRLDAIVDFPAPAPDVRRTLWLAHLGPRHALDDAQLNRIAVSCDLAGGDIRNATLAAASRCMRGTAPGYAELRFAIEAEYRKLGRQAPAGL